MSRRILLLLTLLTLTACEVVDLTPTTAPLNSNTPSDAGWYQLYFTDPLDQDDPENRPEESIDDYVVASIESAQRTVDAVSFDFNLPSMADALLNAHERGLIVRVVTDTDSMGEEQVQRIVEAGIPVVEDNRSAIMHDKFVIADGQIVWTGSWNFSENDTYRNNNNVIGVASPEIVANYQTEFNEMFERDEFGPTSTANTPYPQFTVEGVLIENYFAPEDEVTPKIVAALGTATESIYFAAFAFTSDFISNTIVERSQAGVTVQGVYETRQVNAGSDELYRILGDAGLPVLLDGNRYTMHHKFIVVDSQIVITGSFNFSRAANERNDENILIIHSPEIAAQYLNEFQKVWQKAGGQ